MKTKVGDQECHSDVAPKIKYVMLSLNTQIEFYLKEMSSIKETKSFILVKHVVWLFNYEKTVNLE